VGEVKHPNRAMKSNKEVQPKHEQEKQECEDGESIRTRRNILVEFGGWAPPRGLSKQSKSVWLWWDQGADVEREEDLPQDVPRRKSARTIICVIMDNRGKDLPSLERILLPTGNKYPPLVVARQGLKSEGLRKLPWKKRLARECKDDVVIN
jgi:hypothetical protein